MSKIPTDMNNIFNFNRFGRYFSYELRNARNSYGMTMAVVGLLPAILLGIFALLTLIFNIFDAGVDFTPAARPVAIAAALIIVTFGSPAAIYGSVTDRRAGTDYLLVPASTFEKWLSMILMMCIVVPAVLCVLLFACDSLLALLLPDTYGWPLWQLVGFNPFNIVLDEEISVNLAYPVFLGTASSMLFMTLGAIFFKKSKIAKTILVGLLINVVLSPVSIGVVASADTFRYLDDLSSPYDAARIFNTFMNVVLWGQIVILALAVYFRLRFIKH